jgi:hypothetical protein
LKHDDRVGDRTKWLVQIEHYSSMIIFLYLRLPVTLFFARVAGCHYDHAWCSGVGSLEISLSIVLLSLYIAFGCLAVIGKYEHSNFSKSWVSVSRVIYP